MLFIRKKLTRKLRLKEKSGVQIKIKCILSFAHYFHRKLADTMAGGGILPPFPPEHPLLPLYICIYLLCQVECVMCRMSYSYIFHIWNILPSINFLESYILASFKSKALAQRSQLLTIQRSTCMLSEKSRAFVYLVE